MALSKCSSIIFPWQEWDWLNIKILAKISHQYLYKALVFVAKAASVCQDSPWDLKVNDEQNFIREQHQGPHQSYIALTKPPYWSDKL